MSTSNIDFAALSLKDALDLAILIEEEAEERYQELNNQMALHHTKEAAAFFAIMAGNESRHGQELNTRRKTLFGGEPRTVTREMLWDVEAPDYDQVRAFMSARQALNVAMSSEKKAHDFFVAALPHITDPEVKALFEELREEEIHHQELVQRELDRLPDEPEVDPEDYVDDPVAQ